MPNLSPSQVRKKVSELLADNAKNFLIIKLQLEKTGEWQHLITEIVKNYTAYTEIILYIQNQKNILNSTCLEIMLNAACARADDDGVRCLINNNRESLTVEILNRLIDTHAKVLKTTDKEDIILSCLRAEIKHLKQKHMPIENKIDSKDVVVLATPMHNAGAGIPANTATLIPAYSKKIAELTQLPDDIAVVIQNSFTTGVAPNAPVIPPPLKKTDLANTTHHNIKMRLNYLGSLVDGEEWKVQCRKYLVELNNIIPPFIPHIFELQPLLTYIEQYPNEQPITLIRNLFFKLFTELTNKHVFKETGNTLHLATWKGIIQTLLNIQYRTSEIKKPIVQQLNANVKSIVVDAELYALLKNKISLDDKQLQFFKLPNPVKAKVESAAASAMITMATDRHASSSTNSAYDAKAADANNKTAATGAKDQKTSRKSPAAAPSTNNSSGGAMAAVNTSSTQTQLTPETQTEKNNRIIRINACKDPNKLMELATEFETINPDNPDNPDFNLALLCLKKAKKLNHPPADYSLGVYYLYGLGGVKADANTAFLYFSKAANKHHIVRAWLALADCYLHGRGIPQNKKDEKQAFKCVHTAMERCYATKEYDPDVWLTFSHYEYNGIGTNADKETTQTTTISWLERFLPTAEVQYLTGERYLQGDGIPQNFALARIWLEKAAKQNHRRAKYLTAWFKLGDPETESDAVKILEQCVKEGDVSACFLLAFCHEHEIGGLKSDPTRSAQLYQQAANNNDLYALCYSQISNNWQQLKAATRANYEALKSNNVIIFSHIEFYLKAFILQFKKPRTNESKAEAIKAYEAAKINGSLDAKIFLEMLTWPKQNLQPNPIAAASAAVGIGVSAAAADLKDEKQSGTHSANEKLTAASAGFAVSAAAFVSGAGGIGPLNNRVAPPATDYDLETQIALARSVGNEKLASALAKTYQIKLARLA